MITREDYLNALEIIDNYHRQNDLAEKVSNESSTDKKINKTEIKDWINSLDRQPSTKLANILLDQFRFSEGNPPFKYIEDITKREFLQLRQAGKQSWEEFLELRKQHIFK
jgi:hypothetical protein